jgi:alkanesulfonate monooxygenase SsuD/methylene tetrahydromethanopterin reductase-like flavin-dependent oxidoreductase (luciferase family)
VGGMGSREQNFYNRLMVTYGFERAAEEVQELYLAGRKTEAMFALPDEFIDLVTIVGPRDRAKARIRAFRDAGVDTLIVWPVMPDQDERKKQLGMIAELNEGI